MANGFARRIEDLFARRYTAAGFGVPLLTWEPGGGSDYATIRKKLQHNADGPILWQPTHIAAELTGREIFWAPVRGCGREVTTETDIFVSSYLIDPLEIALGQEHGFSHSELKRYPDPSNEADAHIFAAERSAPAAIIARWHLRTLIERVPWLPEWWLEPWLDFAHFMVVGQRHFLFV